MKVIKMSERDLHEKRWGHEEWIVNNKMYCGKRLVFKKPLGATSLHFHANKHETMYCESGYFVITIVNAADASREQFDLAPGDSIVIPPLTVHRIESRCTPSVMIEFSTHHEDDDSYRVEL